MKTSEEFEEDSGGRKFFRDADFLLVNGNCNFATAKASFIGNFQETCGIKTSWGAVIVAEVVALIALIAT
ncbi:hypothetical protein L484_003242 [Morus notabilis]|uniref:Uncharacterized protein n=1 Tax=Morus notabilis TaxID=981085 RepID=W9RI32_9ROSA|nr:hypothetical protein L484_003242 [Morus notabilis]